MSDTEQEILRAPWTDTQVEALNAYQKGGWFHPFTCGPCRNADPNFPLQNEHLLVATNEGWTCPTCDATQDWAHTFMFEGPPELWQKRSANSKEHDEHKKYHLLVSLTGCGVLDCDPGKAVTLHFQAFNEEEDVDHQLPAPEGAGLQLPTFFPYREV